MTAKKKQPAPPQGELITQDREDTKVPPLVELRIPTPDSELPGATALLDSVKAFSITTSEQYISLADVRARASQRWNEIEAKRVKLKAPVLEAARGIDALFAPALQALANAKELCSTKLEAWDLKQRQLAAEKQRKLDEEARIERERLAAEARKKQQQTDYAMGTIQGIQHQVMIATGGRLGVRKGGTIECIRETLKETEDWRIDPEELGFFTETAQKTKDAAIASIKALEAQFLLDEENKRLAAENVGKTKDAEDAKAQAANERQQRLEAHMAKLRAEEQREAAERETKQLQDKAAEDARLLQERADNTVAVTVQTEQANVAGLSRVKTLKWRLLDKSKLLPAMLIVDEKTISRLVTSMKERAHEVIGAGAIEIYEEQNVRQQRI